MQLGDVVSGGGEPVVLVWWGWGGGGGGHGEDGVMAYRYGGSTSREDIKFQPSDLQLTRN